MFARYVYILLVGGWRGWIDGWMASLTYLARKPASSILFGVACRILARVRSAHPSHTPITTYYRSTKVLELTPPVSNGKYTAAAHFDGKALVDEHIRALGIPHTIIRLGTYTSFVLDSLVPHALDSSRYEMYFPTPMSLTSQLPLIDPAADVGKYVKAILLNPEKTLSRVYNLGERYYSISEIIEILQRNGVNVSLKVISQEDFKAGLAAKGAPEFFQEDLVQVISFGVEFGFFEEGIEGGHEVCDPLLSSIRIQVGTINIAGLTQRMIVVE
jgi:hypothetical protein